MGGSLKGGLSISAGLELSFWVKKPVDGAIAGWLLDLYIPNPAFPLMLSRAGRDLRGQTEGVG